MKRFSLLWVALVAAPMFALPVVAEDAAAKPDKVAAKAAREKAPALRGLHAQMQTELGLSDEQKTQILAKAQEKDAALKAWDTEKKARLDEAGKAEKAARDGGDKQGAKTHQNERRALAQERTAIAQRYDDQINAILTPEQQTKWAGYKAYVGNVGAYKKLNLTEEQKNKIKDRFAAAATQLHAAATDKERKEISQKIRESVEAEVLTAEQRTALAAEREAAKKPKANPTM